MVNELNIISCPKFEKKNNKKKKILLKIGLTNYYKSQNKIRVSYFARRYKSNHSF